ncbi:MAG TPA: SRPBCC domain-containing protein [Candidatus Acidoferrum sp.]|nr:SRPBCC domain-containing protein [Candidatus Acidoferrum sp.]
MNDKTNPAMLGNATTRRQMILGAGVAFGGIAVGALDAWAAADEGIFHAAESIHQEPVLKASRKRVYEALIDVKQFDKVVKLSAAMQSGMSPGKNPTELSREMGGAFSLFGGYVVGRQIELVPNERIVQAWRAGSWNPGIYSIAKFELTEQGTGTKIIFDHTGFPQGTAEHLAEGWKVNYWEPLEKYLA